MKGLRITRNVKEIKFKGSGVSYNQKKVLDNNSQNIGVETNSSFDVK